MAIGMVKKSGKRREFVQCIYCGRQVLKTRAVGVKRGFRVSPKIPSISRGRIFTGGYKAYSCIPCSKHRRLF